MQFNGKSEIIEPLTIGPHIKSKEAEVLEGFSIILTSCFNTLKVINHLNKIENPDIIERITKQLQCKLQDGETSQITYIRTYIFVLRKER